MVKKPIAVSSCTLLWVDKKQSVSTCWVDSSKSWKMRTGYVSLVTGFEGVYSYRWSILFQVAKLSTHSSSHVTFSRLLRAGCLELNDTRTQRGEFFYTLSIHIGFLLPFLLAGHTWAMSSSSQLLWGGQYIMYSVHLRENAAGHWPPRAHPLL